MRNQSSVKTGKATRSPRKTKDNLRLLVGRRSIDKAVRNLARQINKDYAGKDLLVIGILKGSFIFLADLVRHLKMPLEVDFVRCASYGSGTESCGKISLILGLKGDLQGREVLLVEDIVDTGLTTNHIIKYLKRKKPASLKLCSLADKPSHRKQDVAIDYLGFDVPDKFIVGYGIDRAEKYRNLPDIYFIK